MVLSIMPWFEEKVLGENPYHIQSSQVAAISQDSISLRFSCLVFLGDDIALFMVLGFELLVLTQLFC